MLWGVIMETQKQKISLRGSLAAEVAEQLQASPPDAGAIIKDCLRRYSSDIVMIQENDTVVIGRESEVGQYPPDW